MSEDTVVRCPTGTVMEDGTEHTVVGCGSPDTYGPDEEGFWDCGACGMWFTPAEEVGQGVGNVPSKREHSAPTTKPEERSSDTERREVVQRLRDQGFEAEETYEGTVPS